MTMTFSLLRQLIEAEVKPFDKPETGSLEHLVDIIKSKCSNAAQALVDEDYVLWRGWSDPVESGVYNPSSGRRKSENTDNWYTLFYDTNEQNSEYPKRSRSFICTDSKSVAEEYSDGGMTLVFPFDDVTIGVLPEQDIWMIGLERNGDIITPEFLNSAISKLQKHFSEDWRSLDSFIDTLATMSPDDLAVVMKTRFGETGISKLPVYDQADAYADFVSELYAYDEIGATTVDDVADIEGFAGQNSHEVWFSGQCVVLRVTGDAEDFKDQIREMLDE